MKIYKTSVLLLAGLGPCLSWASTGEPATPPAVNYVEVSPRRVVNLGDHTATFVRVRRPNLTKLVTPPPAPPRELTAEEKARYEELEKKAYVSLGVTATVYLNGKQTVTELRWRNEETGNLEYVAYSNADFRYLTQLHHLESDTTVYSWFPFVSAYDLSEWPAEEKPPFPSGLSLSTNQVEYVVDERALGRSDQETTLAGLDYLHAYYQLNYSELKSAYEQRVAAEAERERELKENPPKPQNIVIRFWPKVFPKQ